MENINRKQSSKWSILFIMIIIAFSFYSCKKEYLDKKPDKALLVPTTLSDFQALLDNYNQLNKTPFLTEVSSDDYYTTPDGLTSYSPTFKNCYLWMKDPYAETSVQDWTDLYAQVLRVNVVLDGLKNISVTNANQAEFDRVKGSALFFRAYLFYNLAQEFSRPYSVGMSETGLGIPLRLTSDVNQKSVRSGLKSTYDQIFKDLLEAETLLPQVTTLATRPSKTAAHALLARIYLSIGEYTKAGNYADSALRVNNKLVDYSTLNPTAARPFPRALPVVNDEVIFYSALIQASFLQSSTLTIIDSNLYRSYVESDLRKTIFFIDRGNKTINFKGSYDGSSILFTGLATDELYLIRAESYARQGKVVEAMTDLNTLLVTRWKRNTFVPYNASSGELALSLILQERRKELIFRGIRWTDLRRFNQSSGSGFTLQRKLSEQTYTLPPGDPRYALPIPQDEINFSGIEQNER